MKAKIIDGKVMAAELQQTIAKKIQASTAKGKRAPGLATLLVGNDPASEIYIRHKQNACEQVGIHSQHHQLSEEITTTDLIELIHQLNDDANIDGILIQLPLPKHIDSQLIIEAIDPRKDVDGLHPYNMGRLIQKKPTIHSCTPAGCMALIRSTGIDLTGKEAVVVGASNLVGRPMAIELLLENCTVTICNSKTNDLHDKVARGDILVTAVGKPELIKGSWIKPGAIVIDVGINRHPDNKKLIGDIEFETAKDRAAYITPVPGGVGPMTVTMLLNNCLEIYSK